MDLEVLARALLLVPCGLVGIFVSSHVWCVNEFTISEILYFYAYISSTTVLPNGALPESVGRFTDQIHCMVMTVLCNIWSFLETLLLWHATSHNHSRRLHTPTTPFPHSIPRHQKVNLPLQRIHIRQDILPTRHFHPGTRHSRTLTLLEYRNLPYRTRETRSPLTIETRPYDLGAGPSYVSAASPG